MSLFDPKSALNLSEKPASGASNLSKTPDKQDSSAFEAVGAVSGKVSEVVGDLPQEKPSETASGTAKKSQPVSLTPEEKKAQLLSRLPENEVAAVEFMTKDIERVTAKKLRQLEAESSQKNLHPHRLANLLREIRQLRDMLSTLVGMAFEMLKTLWLKVVHGLSV
jgi:hypothetical protein